MGNGYRSLDGFKRAIPHESNCGLVSKIDVEISHDLQVVRVCSGHEWPQLEEISPTLNLGSLYSEAVATQLTASGFYLCLRYLVDLICIVAAALTICPGACPPNDEPSLREIMAAIQVMRNTMEPKIDAITTEVNFLRPAAESQIEGLQATTKRLEEQVHALTKQTATIAARLEDQSKRSNIRVDRVPEVTEGPSADLCLEDLIINTLHPKRLSKFFSVIVVLAPCRNRVPLNALSFTEFFTSTSETRF
ncbi:hypothetical protein NDU88_001643 [Pleurodeles waltl]|uniref:Uncharacterized protein n=1 Tax=Pleurodeles waltl TaxID=8319 RepID=A0AAV7KQ37_PLEWA|nr:hypothetical protein NDU88_001643 [Pleurodeles waltl]